MLRALARAVNGAMTVGAALIGGAVAPASAQDLPDTGVEQHGWLSLGLGTSSVAGSLSAVGSFWYTRRALALAFQSTSNGAEFGEQRDGLALLAGRTSGTATRRLVGALGLAHVHSHFTCEDFCADVPDATHLALAFAGEAFVNRKHVGFGVDTFGALGASRASYVGVGLSVQLGRLGTRH